MLEELDQMLAITINRPERLNAFCQKTIDEMNAALEAACRRADIGVIIITVLASGLINSVVPPGKLMDEVQTWPNDILGLSRAALQGAEALS